MNQINKRFLLYFSVWAVCYLFCPPVRAQVTPAKIIDATVAIYQSETTDTPDPLAALPVFFLRDAAGNVYGSTVSGEIPGFVFIIRFELPPGVKPGWASIMVDSATPMIDLSGNAGTYVRNPTIKITAWRPNAQIIEYVEIKK